MRIYYISKTATAGPGADSGACSSIVTCAASQARSQRPALLQAAAETDCLYWQRRRESCSSSSSLQRGWSARMATRWSSHRLACPIRYRYVHVSSPANDSFRTFMGGRSGFALTIHTFRTVDRTAGRRFGREKVIILVTIVRFGKPLFANKHHRVYAVAGALRKPTVACPHPDVSTGWPVMGCDRHWVHTPQIPVCWPFVDQTDFFLHLLSSLKAQLLIWSALKTMAVNSKASSELQVELLPRLSRNLSCCCAVGERTFGTWRWIFKLWDQISCLQQH